jgi:hypothetical protein
VTTHTRSKVVVDRKRSALIIDGQLFPAAGLLCPADDDGPTAVPDRMLGSSPDSPMDDWWLPMESGVVAWLTEHPVLGRLDLSLAHIACERAPFPGGETTWLPSSLRIEHGRLVSGWQSWDDCEPWWLREHLVRVSTMPVDPIEGPRCQLVPFTHWPACDSSATPCTS